MITEKIVKKAMALYSNNQAGNKVVQDALHAAKQGDNKEVGELVTVDSKYKYY